MHFSRGDISLGREDGRTGGRRGGGRDVNSAYEQLRQMLQMILLYSSRERSRSHKAKMTTQKRRSARRKHREIYAFSVALLAIGCTRSRIGIFCCCLPAAYEWKSSTAWTACIAGPAPTYIYPALFMSSEKCERASERVSRNSAESRPLYVSFYCLRASSLVASRIVFSCIKPILQPYVRAATFFHAEQRSTIIILILDAIAFKFLTFCSWFAAKYESAIELYITNCSHIWIPNR